MATDNTPPRLKLIVTIGVITGVTLFSLDFVLKSYFGYMTTEAERMKIAAPKDREAHHAEEQAAFTKASVPMDQAIAQVAKGTRSDVIAPKQSDDLGSMTGWSKLPKPAPAAVAAPSPTGPMPTSVGDAGALPPTGDAGAPVGPGVPAKDAGTGTRATPPGPQPPGIQHTPKGAPQK